eukprot:sb/3471162/
MLGKPDTIGEKLVNHQIFTNFSPIFHHFFTISSPSHPTSFSPNFHQFFTNFSPFLHHFFTISSPSLISEEVASLPAEEPEPTKVETAYGTTADVAVPEKEDKEEEDAGQLDKPADVEPAEKGTKKEDEEEEEYVDYEEEGGSEGDSEEEEEEEGEKSDEESPTHIPRRGRFYQHDDRNYVETSSAPPTG